MRTRSITALAAALALFAAVPAAAQHPSPTAVQSQADDGSPAEPPKDASDDVKAVYDDYADDGRVDVCDHERDVLQETLDTIEEDVDRDFPDFREAIRAGIERHDRGRCESAEPTPAPTTDGAGPNPTPAPTVESGDLPDADDGFPDDGGDAVPPPADDGALPPEDPSQADESGVVPEGAPAVPPPVPTATPTPSATPIIVTSSRTDELVVPGILLAVALLGAAALALAAYGARRSPRWEAAVREASFRVRTTWADFTDWLRLGR
jgi:hypothetical protein